jgi:hypothetical protein
VRSPHLLRELIAVTETGTPGVEGSIAQATVAINALLRLKDLAEAARAQGREPEPVALA